MQGLQGIRGAVLFGALIGGAFTVVGLLKNPSPAEFGYVLGSAIVGALLCAVVYRVVIGNK